MKIFIEYKGEQYGYIVNSTEEDNIDYLRMLEIFNGLMRTVNILTPELDNFINKLGGIVEEGEEDDDFNFGETTLE